MSTPQDNKMATAGAENASTSQICYQSTTKTRTQAIQCSNEHVTTQDAGEKSASPAQDRTSGPSVSQTNTNPDDPVGNPDPIPLGYSLDPDAPPGTYDHLDMYPGINLRQNMENAFKLSFEEMLGHFGQANDEAAEAIANNCFFGVICPFFTAPTRTL